MKTSDSIAKIAPALTKAFTNIGAAKKDSANPYFKSAFASLGEVMEVCKQPLLDQEIIVLQEGMMNRPFCLFLIRICVSLPWLRNKHQIY